MANIARWRRHVNDYLLTDPVLSNALSTESVETHCRSAGHRWRTSFWSPPITLFTFVLQVLSAEKTLRAGVVNLLTRLAAQGRQNLPSQDPTAYCQARQRLHAIRDTLYACCDRAVRIGGNELPGVPPKASPPILSRTQRGGFLAGLDDCSEVVECEKGFSQQGQQGSKRPHYPRLAMTSSGISKFA